MSWNNVIPGWLCGISAERNEAKLLGAFEEEVLAGWVHSTPDNWVDLDIIRRGWEERQFASLGVRLVPR